MRFVVQMLNDPDPPAPSRISLVSEVKQQMPEV